jgi:hypothetical protein
MASNIGVTERCLLCRRELPRGGFSARVARIFLSPLCAECERRCSTDPQGVVAEHPQLFEHPEAKGTYVPDTGSVTDFDTAVRNQRPTVLTQAASSANMSDAGP